MKIHLYLKDFRPARKPETGMVRLSRDDNRTAEHTRNRPFCQEFSGNKKPRNHAFFSEVTGETREDAHRLVLQQYPKSPDVFEIRRGRPWSALGRYGGYPPASLSTYAVESPPPSAFDPVRTQGALPCAPTMFIRVGADGGPPLDRAKKRKREVSVLKVLRHMKTSPLAEG